MKPLAHTVPVKTSILTLWAVLLDERRNPARYDPSASAMKMTEDGEDVVVRQLNRAGTMFQERIELHLDALMIEHQRTVDACRDVTLIIQLIPAEPITLLNLALNIHKSDDESLTDQPLPDLIALADNIKETAEAI
jgi:hypothetical protein